MSEAIKKLLKEVDALKEQLSILRPLPEEALRKIQDALDIEYTYESNRIEGNTLTLQETALVVNEGVTISGKSMREHLEAINHTEAISYIKDIAKQDIEISERTIKEIHALILHGIDRENAGRYRTVPVMISGSAHMPPQPYLIEKQMEDFMFVMDLNPDGVSLDSEILTVGHKVKVIKGELSGIEGEVAIEANKTYVVIRIKDLLTASIKVPKSYLKIIG